MEVAQTPSNGGLPPPFHDHDVHEWSTLDSLTGVLERARIETDHWAANTTNTSHKYGKVVDSRARTDADGALRQQARRQLEVFQSQVPGGHLQVIKSHSVSSSRWTNKRIEEAKGGEFEGLQIPSNQLDLSFQKSRAVIGRSAARRPPTRIKNKDDTSPIRQDNLHRVASANLQKVTRLCHQIHENAVKQSFGKFTNGSPIENRLKITSASEKNDEATNSSNGHTNLLRTKSSSSEDFLINLNKDKSTKSIEDLEDLEHLQTWRRTSKIRRSLQYPKLEKPLPNKPIDLPETSVSVRKITEDFEKGRRLSTALRGNNIDLQALDQILQTISSSSSEKNSTLDEEAESSKINSLQSKRNSFVTVESIQEIKGRLRRTSSPDNNPYQKVKDQEIDDGIVTEDSYKTEEKMIDSGRVTGHAKVKSYVFGMDYMKKPMIGTGSLESRSKLLNGTTNRSEDWYNRRKSYGFEPVHNQNETMSSNKKLVESSTDSGICRSSEVIIIPSAINHVDPKGYASNNNGGLNNNIEKDASFGNVRRISSLFDNPTTKTNSFHPEFNSSWTKKNKENDWSLNPGITIKIPIVSNNSHWDDHPERDIKRHSIAVDETKYVSKSTVNNEARRTSLVINEKFLNAPTTTEGCDSDYSGLGKKSKKVEFCKTEVHFAAESGKVNIVETDEKPPPTQNFRRRRRNPSYPSDFNKNGLPVLHFGENYVEKTLFANGNQQYPEEVASGEETEPSTISRTPISHVVTVNSDFNSLGAFDDDRRESAENESIKGILKNKMVKPKPYHLGQNPIDFNFFDDENRNWSSEKFPEKDPPPIWKSTVTVSSTIFDNRKVENNNSILNNQPDLIKDQLKRLEDYHHDLRRVEPTERTRPFLSVADRIRNMEESQKVDNHRGYSTRVNIGEGQAIVVQNNALNKHDMFTEPVKQEPKDSKLRQQTEATNRSEEPIKIKAEIKNRKYSPIVLRKHPIVIKTAELKSANTSTKLSSPLLVGRSSNNIENKVKTRPHDIRTAKADAESKPVHDFNTIEENNQNGFVSNEKILRQPKKSEMAYFGVPISSQVDKTTCENHIKEIRTSTNKTSSLKREQVHSARTDSPIYQNISPTQNEESKENSKFDSCILEELTKAADEILQAVKDYSEEESRKQKELEETKTELSTITENKTWKQETKVKSIERPCKSKLRNASSNSSLETSPKDSKPTHRYISNTKASADKIKTRTSSSESSGLKASTRARRLQRASSREALLQSHGSSSEDLATNEVPVRKPRLVRKTKTTQLTVTNGMEMARKGTIATNAKKKVETTKAKTEERLPGALPEIRHKTAVSTIRSTAEKAARDRSKHRGDDVKKKVAQCKEITKVSASPTTPVKSKRETVTHRLATAYVPACSPSHRKTHIYDYYQSQDQCPCLCS
ncbi:uncharacterized protein LOC123313034 isoform X5 [Coccinella septempunctata]|uniref:uncharacterized protein LOC123313034 isoform X5 n=1 Tax=Coccinella septempunctata TaxID=41139 RepID=UPI001D068A21|nr:uncharacterized protein LOC123313034 isoform X5 [Coccinella septempunctata]